MSKIFHVHCNLLMMFNITTQSLLSHFVFVVAFLEWNVNLYWEGNCYPWKNTHPTKHVIVALFIIIIIIIIIIISILFIIIIITKQKLNFKYFWLSFSFLRCMFVLFVYCTFKNKLRCDFSLVQSDCMMKLIKLKISRSKHWITWILRVIVSSSYLLIFE